MTMRVLFVQQVFFSETKRSKVKNTIPGAKMHFLFPNKIWKLPQSIQVCQTKEHAQFDVDIGIQKSDWMGLNVIESNIKYKN